MIDFSAMTGRVGRGLRMFVRVIPQDATLRVLQGRLRGAKWIAGASSAGCWLGSYETDVQELVTQLLKEGGVFYDLGANVGFFSLLASRLVGPAGHVYAFEPLPDNLKYLRRHVDLNEGGNISVIPAAVCDRTGTAAFGGEKSKAKLMESGPISVDTVALDELWKNGRIRPPSVVKMDVEGGELSALLGMQELLEATLPHMLIEFHGQFVDGLDIDTECRTLLRNLGYRIEKFGHEVHAVPPS